MPKRIVVFADGTGNAFTSQESNVWRLYHAVDKSQPDQIARYIRGVGTSGFRPFAAIDGATGIGVPANVRKLYRFICWTWQPGDEIWMFGFSRGAFTVRTLVGLIHHEGLVPASVTHAEMDRNAMAAWRSYRAKSAADAVWPTIRVTRWVRDRVIRLARWVRGQEQYETVRARVEAQGRDSIPIRFLGVFDTVEAFGVPIEELRIAIDRIVWPISFRTRDLRGKVDDARHALSLDDERTSFHPIRFEPPTGLGPRIEEIWFSGVHSDVGGGYPDDTLAHVPLVWMAEEAKEQGLRFEDGALDDFRRLASPFGPLHDSRTGLAAAYRYDPRRVAPGEAAGTAPVIHSSVMEKMTLGSENYAPVSLPATALVRMPDGTIRALGAPPPTSGGPAIPRLSQDDTDASLPQFKRLNPTLPIPTPELIEQTWDLVWWRRVAYFALLASALATVALPWTAGALTAIAQQVIVGAASLVGHAADGQALWARLTGSNSGIASALQTISGSLGGLIPSYLSAWTTVFVEHFFGSMLLVSITFALYRWNDALRDRIAERAVQAWSGACLKAPAQTPALAFARWGRQSPPLGAAYHTVTRFVPYLAIGCVFLTALAGLSHGVMDYRSGAGHVCLRSEKPEPVQGAAVVAASVFTPDALCWASGIVLKKGRSYTLWIDATEPFEDAAIPTGLVGFESSRPAFVLAKGIRRRWGAAWFQVLARVGDVGGTEWALVPADGASPIDLDAARAAPSGRPAAGRLSVLDETGRQEPEQQASQGGAIAARTPERLVSTFTAPADGELFLYVNDAVYAAPILPIVTAYYRNNSGKARVVIGPATVPELPAAP